MARLIDADALIEAMGLQNCKKYGNADAKELADSYGQMSRYELKDAIDDAPTVDAVAHGRWERYMRKTEFSTEQWFRCSACKRYRFRNGEMVTRYKYCPYCGARMEGAEPR